MDAEIQAEHMLKYQELKFKSLLPKLSEVLYDAEARMPSKLRKGYVFSGLQELKETAQSKVPEAEHVNVTQLLSTSKRQLPFEDQDAVYSTREDARLFTKVMKRSSSACPHVELPDTEECNYLMFRKRFHQKKGKAADGGNANQNRQWQKDLRPDVVVPPRAPLPCNCNFRLHLAI